MKYVHQTTIETLGITDDIFEIFKFLVERGRIIPQGFDQDSFWGEITGIRYKYSMFKTSFT